MRSFPTDIVLSLTTGILLKKGGFGEMQELCEHIAGHPIWTHQLADKKLVERLVDAVHQQHPQLKDVEKWDAEGKDLYTYLNEYVARQVAKFGESLSIASASFESMEDPFTSFERLVNAAQRAGE